MIGTRSKKARERVPAGLFAWRFQRKKLDGMPAAAFTVQLLDREVAGSARRRYDTSQNRKGNQGSGDGLHDHSPKV